MLCGGRRRRTRGRLGSSRVHCSYILTDNSVSFSTDNKVLYNCGRTYSSPFLLSLDSQVVRVHRRREMRRRDSLDSDYGDDSEIVAIDEDDLHEHLDGISEGKIKIGSNTYTKEEKKLGVQESKAGFDKAMGESESAVDILYSNDTSSVNDIELSVQSKSPALNPSRGGSSPTSSPTRYGSSKYPRSDASSDNGETDGIDINGLMGYRPLEDVELQLVASAKEELDAIMKSGKGSKEEIAAAKRKYSKVRVVGCCGEGCFGDKGLADYAYLKTKSLIEYMKLKGNTKRAYINRAEQRYNTLKSEGNVYSVTWVVTALVMALLKYVFCVVGAVIIHDSHRFMQASLAVGVGVQCSSTLITGMITGRFSKIGINVSGPDIIASIFVSAWVKTLCDGKNPLLTEETALPTILFLMAASTFLMGLIWYCIGYFHATKLVEFMPAPVVCGFLSCIGWKVIKYATKVSAGTAWYVAWEHEAGWAFLLAVPGAVMGIPLYLLKKYHIGNPMVVLPFYMVAPIVVFYICVVISGETFDELRANHWLFPAYQPAHFYQVWTELKWEHINYNAIPLIMVDLCIMIIILVIDSLLKLASTKTGCQLDVDMVHEMKVTGMENLIGSLFMGSPGYPQVKFNLLSYGILNNTRERRVAYFVALFGGVMWFAGSGFMLIHYLPRFYLGGLLWYAACPFIVQNLIETSFHMERMGKLLLLLLSLVQIIPLIFFFFEEYFIVLSIFGTVVIFDLMGNAAAMLIAVGVGALLATIVFMLSYARVTVIREQYNLASKLEEGKNYQSKVVRRLVEDALLARCANRTAYIQLEGFIFFASAVQVLSRIKEIIKESEALVMAERNHESTPFKKYVGQNGTILKVYQQKDKESGGTKYNYKIKLDHVFIDSDGFKQTDHEKGVVLTVRENDFVVVDGDNTDVNDMNSQEKNNDKNSPAGPYSIGSRIRLVKYLKNEGRIGEYVRLRYMVIDFEHVQSNSADDTPTVGMDFSGLRTFAEVKRLLKENHVFCLFTGISPMLADAFRRENICDTNEMNNKDNEDKSRENIVRNWPMDPRGGWVDDNGEYIIHTAEDMDRGAEIVENKTLERCAKLRKNWLLFDSFKKIHVEAQLKTKHQVFDLVLSGDAGANLYAYANFEVREPGEFIVTEGTQNENIYLLQHGKVTAWTAQTESKEATGEVRGKLRRLRTMRGSSGAVINGDSIFTNRVVSHSVVVDEKSVVWKITKQNLKKMERDSPTLACEIHRHISKFSLICRDRLEREIINLEILDRFTQNKKSGKKSYFSEKHRRSKNKINVKAAINSHGKSAENIPQPKNNLKIDSGGHASNSLAQSISKSLMEAHWNMSHMKTSEYYKSEHKEEKKRELNMLMKDETKSEHNVTLAQLHDTQHHGGHRFQHINTALEIINHNKEEEEEILKERPWWLNVEPHVSGVMATNAKKAFDMWADDYDYDQKQDEKRIKMEEMKHENIFGVRRSMSQTTDEELSKERSSFLSQGTSSSESMGSLDTSKKAGARRSFSTTDHDALTATKTVKESTNGTILSSLESPVTFVKLREAPAKRNTLLGTKADIFSHPALTQASTRRVLSPVSPRMSMPPSLSSNMSPRKSPRNSPTNQTRLALPTLSLNDGSPNDKNGEDKGRDSGLNTHKFIDVHLIQKVKHYIDDFFFNFIFQ